ncbi:MAG: 50S ribosomal protein L23 [Candidatus Kerfeldbacteria bacterium]|nr:50S ribosomal protein L23 [Candidatus Kerfeldbacteria bacterium]
MAFLDRFKPKKEAGLGKDKKPKHVVTDAKSKAAESKKKQFAAVPAGGKETKPTKPAEAGNASAPKRIKGDTGNAYRVLVRAVVSEKATRLASERQYIFMVGADANKISVASAIRKLYGVTPTAVNIINVPGKALRYGRTEGRTKNWKKAVVTLKSGDRIEVTG